MKIEAFVLCDAATESYGKLNVLGAFDQIYAAKLPLAPLSCAVALRLRFAKMEEGPHRVRLQFVDSDGKSIFPPMEGPIYPRMGADVESVAVNMIINLQNIKLDAFADYQINLAVDNIAMASLPLRIREAPTLPPSA